jgi:5-methylcytosine-specific restriction protein A
MPKASRRVQQDARAIVRTRDGHRCLRCGASVLNIPSSIHHRINKGAGGSALLERPSLLVRMCGLGSGTITSGCHDWIRFNVQAAKDTGWLLPKNNPDIDPTCEPLLTFAGWVLLDDEGGSQPYEGAA